MNWKVVAALGAGVGGVVWAVRRRTRREALTDTGWSAATDRVEAAPPPGTSFTGVLTDRPWPEPEAS